MREHHDMHQQAYVDKVDAALDAIEWAGWPIDEVLRSSTPAPTSHNSGGHSNHSLFWTWMSPNDGGSPQVDLAAAIHSTFGSFDLRAALKDAGALGGLQARARAPRSSRPRRSAGRRPDRSDTVPVILRYPQRILFSRVRASGAESRVGCSLPTSSRNRRSDCCSPTTKETEVERRDGTLALPSEEQRDPGQCLLDSG